MNHQQLLENLARAKNSIYINCPLGSTVLNNGVPVADLMVVRPSYTQFCLDIFEVKASRADFQSDIRTGKWKKYLPYCQRLYFAVLDGVCTKDEIPEDVGLYIYNEDKKAWHCARQAKSRIVEDKPEVLKSMAFLKNKNAKKYRKHFYLYNGIEIKELKRISRQIGKSFSEFIAFHNDRATQKNRPKIAEYQGVYLPEIKEE